MNIKIDIEGNIEPIMLKKAYIFAIKQNKNTIKNSSKLTHRIELKVGRKYKHIKLIRL